MHLCWAGRRIYEKQKYSRSRKCPVYSYHRNTHYLFRETYEGGGFWRTDSNI